MRCSPTRLERALARPNFEKAGEPPQNGQRGPVGSGFSPSCRVTTPCGLRSKWPRASPSSRSLARSEGARNLGSMRCGRPPDFPLSVLCSTACCMCCWFAADRGAARGGHCKSKSALPRVRRRSPLAGPTHSTPADLPWRRHGRARSRALKGGQVCARARLGNACACCLQCPSPSLGLRKR